MWRALTISAAILGLTAVSWAQETPQATTVEKSAAGKLKENANDIKALNDYINQVMTGVIKIMEEQPDAAKKQLREMSAFVGELKPDAKGAIDLVERAKLYATTYSRRIDIQQTPLADIEKKLAANADDTEALSEYSQKMAMEISKVMRDRPEEALKLLDAFKAGLAKVSDNAKEAATRTQLTNANRQVSGLERSIASAKKLLELIGKDAAPLNVETWVNGSPLTDSDLKGKVVLLDFWAVWCGPCIATFPHLREWNEKYGEKGLVMIGLTRYYEYDWNAETKKAGRVPGTSHEKEQEMLVKFAESYGLKHRFGIQAEDNTMASYYGVTGIPHVVVIDQQGKVRLMKVGSGEDNAKAISAMLEKLLAEKTGG